jgi:hypothetical protein
MHRIECIIIIAIQENSNTFHISLYLSVVVLVCFGRFLLISFTKWFIVMHAKKTFEDWSFTCFNCLHCLPISHHTKVQQKNIYKKNLLLSVGWENRSSFDLSDSCTFKTMMIMIWSSNVRVYKNSYYTSPCSMVSSLRRLKLSSKMCMQEI